MSLRWSRTKAAAMVKNSGHDPEPLETFPERAAGRG